MAKLLCKLTYFHQQLMADAAEFTLLSTQSLATLYTPAHPLSEGRLNAIQQSLKSVAARALLGKLGEIDEYDWGADRFGRCERGAGLYPPAFFGVAA